MAFASTIKKLHSKPGHETVKHILCNILKDQLGAKDDEIVFEDQLKVICKGRIDALWGRTIFEIKSNLEKERQDAESQIKKYIQSKEKETQEKYIGIATDGRQYSVYSVLNGNLKLINEFTLKQDNSKAFIMWLESVILIKDQLEASPEIICKEIGQSSPLCKHSIEQINSLWISAKSKPDVRLKYELWKKSVEIVYGTSGIDESLFIEHTYLTIISKSIAQIAFFEQIPKSGEHILNGKQFKDSNVFGIIENDFFSWITLCDVGNNLVKKVATHIKRFDFSTIKADILKDLYEGLIRQERRHQNGEYYTPDWLAEKTCKDVIKKPLEYRVIDPACGSGAFLFHSIKLLISKAKEKQLPHKKIIDLICEKIAGIDIHPVAVIFSRITYLLAMLNEIKQDRPDSITIPVYLGDALQWSKDEVLGKYELKIKVPEDKQTGAKKRQLIFPESICQNSKNFDKCLREMIELAGKCKEKHIFQAWIQKHKSDIDQHSRETLLNTYQDLLELQQENRNHIWGYVARNLTRPIWLSSENQKADIVIGNPPWLRFNAMNRGMKKKFKNECQVTQLLPRTKESSKFQTSQDISTYFLIISVHLYMREKGKLAFVMPYGVINGEHHQAFRDGNFLISGSDMKLEMTKAWVFDSQVKNLFKIPSCVLFFKRRINNNQVLPDSIISFTGVLPRKNCDLPTANELLSSDEKAWPNIYVSPDLSPYSEYFDAFKQGASLVPRRFCFVKKIQTGRLGSSSSTPLVKGVVSNLDKLPWNNITPLEAKIESQFLKTVYTGQSIAPFRIIRKNIGVIPWGNNHEVMNSEEAENRGYTHLSSYLEQVENLWKKHGTKKMSFKRRINYNRTLENQFPISNLRVIYTASGTNVAAVLLKDSEAIIDYKLYWTSVASENEGVYLEGILNSSYLIEEIRDLQSQGQWGPRDICRHLLKPPIPKYNSKNLLHKNIVQRTKKIKQIVQNVKLESDWGFKKCRKHIREEIKNTDDNWSELNELVRQLIEKPSLKEANIEKQRIQQISRKERLKNKKFMKQ